MNTFNCILNGLENLDEQPIPDWVQAARARLAAMDPAERQWLRNELDTVPAQIERLATDLAVLQGQPLDAAAFDQLIGEFETQIQANTPEAVRQHHAALMGLGLPTPPVDLQRVKAQWEKTHVLKSLWRAEMENRQYSDRMDARAEELYNMSGLKQQLLKSFRTIAVLEDHNKKLLAIQPPATEDADADEIE